MARQRPGSGKRVNEAPSKPCVSKIIGFRNFTTEHRDTIEARLRRGMGASAKVSKRVVNAAVRSAWASLDEAERLVYSQT